MALALMRQRKTCPQKCIGMSLDGDPPYGMADDVRSAIRVNRKGGRWRDRLRAYKVLVDSEEAGRVRPGQSIDVSVTPGMHDVQIAIDWCRSPVVTVDVGLGQTMELMCAPNTGQSQTRAITSGRGEYVLLWPTNEAR